MSQKVKSAKTCIDVYKLSLQRHEAWIKENIQTATMSQIRIRISEICSNYSGYQKNAAIIEAEEGECNATIRNEIDDLYYSVRPTLEDKLEELNDLKSPPTPITNVVPPVLSAKLPEMSLLSFSGDIMKWSEFIETFDSLVHSNTSLSNIAKFQYLKHSLKDAAANAIESLDFNDANYTVARQILHDRFNRPNRICEHHIKSLFCARAVEKPCALRLMELLDGFNSHLRSLKTLKRPTSQWDDLIVYLFVSKLDVDTRTKWYENAPNDKLAMYFQLFNHLNHKEVCAFRISFKFFIFISKTRTFLSLQ